MTFPLPYSPTKVKCQWHEGCGNEFFKFRSMDKYCPAHRYMSIKLNKVQQKGRKQPNTPIKKVSDKRAIQNKEYLRLRKQFLKENPNCAVYPYLKATDVHHKKGRIGNLLTDTRYFLAVSRQAHTQIELNPNWARENGYILNRK